MKKQLPAKIDISKIRGRWTETSDGYVAGGDDTISSIQMVADRVNELIASLAPEEPEECGKLINAFGNVRCAHHKPCPLHDVKKICKDCDDSKGYTNCANPKPCYLHDKVKIDPEEFKKMNFKVDIQVEPSGRIDYCSQCDGEHGYHCPLDIEPEDDDFSRGYRKGKECLQEATNRAYAKGQENGKKQGLKELKEKLEEQRRHIFAKYACTSEEGSKQLMENAIAQGRKEERERLKGWAKSRMELGYLRDSGCILLTLLQ